MSSLTRDRVLKEALADLGYSESPAGSNRTKYGKWYPMDGNPWCAMFCSYFFREDLSTIWGKFARTDTKAKALNSAGKLVKGNAGLRKGDLVFFAFNGPSYQSRYLGIHHVGFYLGKLADGRFKTLEGNTSTSSSDNGGQVKIRYRSPDSVVAYFRPDYAPAVVAPVPAPSPAPTLPTLRLGSEDSSAVKKLQRELNQSGAKLVVDGDFGPKTEGAVEDFQKRYKLEVDGIVGPKTWAKLLSVSGAAPSATKTGTVTAKRGLRVRKGPGTGYSRIGALPYNAKVTIVSTSQGWHKIKFAKGYGFVSSAYVK